MAEQAGVWAMPQHWKRVVAGVASAHQSLGAPESDIAKAEPKQARIRHCPPMQHGTGHPGALRRTAGAQRRSAAGRKWCRAVLSLHPWLKTAVSCDASWGRARRGCWHLVRTRLVDAFSRPFDMAPHRPAPQLRQTVADSGLAICSTAVTPQTVSVTLAPRRCQGSLLSAVTLPS